MGNYRAFILFWLMFILTTSHSFIEAESNDQEAEKAESDVINLDEIIVSATRTPASLDSVSASSLVVPEKQIRSSTAADLGHLLGMTNILEIWDYGSGGISLASMRGSSSEQVLVLVNGERINDSRNGGVDLDNVPIAYAKRIEIVRGGQSAMYGADAVGGIINIITRQPFGTTARAWSSLGSYDSAAWGMEASKQVKTVSGLISFSQAGSEGDFPYEDKHGKVLIRENADFMKRSVFGNVRWDISDSAVIRLSGDHNHSDKGDPGPIGQYSPDATKLEKSSGLRLDMEQSLKRGTLYKLSAYERDAMLGYTNPQQPYPVDDTHKTDAMGTELQVYLLQNLSIPLICGFSFRDEDITSTALGNRGRKTGSGYVQQELRRDFDNNIIQFKAAVFPSIRWDRYSDFQAGISPKIGSLVSFGQYRLATVKANIGRSYRAPTLNELYWPSDPFAVGNPDLKPERSIDADVGIHFRLSEPLPHLSEFRYGVTCFQNTFRNRIQWSPGANGKWFPQNLSEAHLAGVEAESLWNVSDIISLGVNYTFLKAEDALKRQLIYRPRHSMGYTLRVGTGKMWAQIQGLYHSRRYANIENTIELEPFMKHDLQLGLERRLWNTASLGMVLEVRNVFDKRYQLMEDYPLPGREWGIKTSIGMGGE